MGRDDCIWTIQSFATYSFYESSSAWTIAGVDLKQPHDLDPRSSNELGICTS